RTFVSNRSLPVQYRHSLPTRRSSDLGAVIIEVFHNSQLGDTTEMLDQARAGANVGTVTDVARLSDFVPPLAIMSAPFLFDTYDRSEEHTSELQSRENLVCRLLLEKKK